MESAMNERLDRALAVLIERGEITSLQAESVRIAYDANPHIPAGPPRVSRRNMLGEVGGYVGGIFTVVAVSIILSQSWDQLTDGGKVGILAGISAILLLTAFFVGRTSEVRRRLAGTLDVGGAFAAAGAAGFAATMGYEAIAASGVGLVVAAASYFWNRSVPGQIAFAGFLAVFLSSSLFKITNFQESGIILVVLLILGALWILASLQGLLPERMIGLLLGSFAIFVASQIAFSTNLRPLSYAISFGAAVVGFLAYLRFGYWPLLVLAVVMSTFGVGELVGATLGGAFGAALGLLAAGIALLAGSAFALNQRKERRVTPLPMD
jgi:hypothetical protein